MLAYRAWAPVGAVKLRPRGPSAPKSQRADLGEFCAETAPGLLLNGRRMIGAFWIFEKVAHRCTICELFQDNTILVHHSIFV